MPIPPAVPLGGLAGFRFIERTYDRQIAVFNASPDIDRDVSHFLENAGSITTVDQLMDDRQSLRVILGAFGLDADINKGAFVRMVIEDGTLEPRAFANRLVEPAYREMSESLGFGNFGGTLIQESKRTEIVNRYRERQFELAVGESDLDLRLALNFKREAERIAQETPNDRTAWLRMLGAPPMRQVVETAFNLPREFAQIDIDRQVDILSDRARDFLGTPSPQGFLDEANLDAMVERFLLLSQVRNGVIGPSVRGSTALTLLQSSPLGSGAQQGLFASNFL